MFPYDQGIETKGVQVMTDPYNRDFTFGHDWAGGLTLYRTDDGASVYFQPGDDAREADNRFDRLVGECGYSGEAALAILWSDYGHLATVSEA